MQAHETHSTAVGYFGGRFEIWSPAPEVGNAGAGDIGVSEVQEPKALKTAQFIEASVGHLGAYVRGLARRSALTTGADGVGRTDDCHLLTGEPRVDSRAVLPRSIAAFGGQASEER